MNVCIKAFKILSTDIDLRNQGWFIEIDFFSDVKSLSSSGEI